MSPDKDDRSIEDREQAMHNEAGQMEQRLDELGKDIENAEAKAKDIRPRAEPGADSEAPVDDEAEDAEDAKDE